MSEVPAFAAHYRASDDTWQSLEDHLLGVAELTGSFADKLGLKEQGELLGLVHDLGKYSQAFQAYLKSATGALNQDEDEEWVDAEGLRGKIDHSTAGAQYIWHLLTKDKPAVSRQSIAAQALALCIASHHSGLCDCLGGDKKRFGDDVFGARMSKSFEKTHAEEARRSADKAIAARAEQLLSEPALVDSVLRLIEDIVETEHEVRPMAREPHLDAVTQFKVGLLVRFLFSCLIDADRIDTADFEKKASRRTRQHGRYVDWHVLIHRLERHLSRLTTSRPIDSIRNDVSRHCFAAAARNRGRIYTLTVPTGGGKTLASLRFALHHAKAQQFDRIVFVIPFTSIIDQNAQQVRGILEPASALRSSIVLEHHSNVTPELQGWREKILSENWDAPVIYTTSVQFLETVFGAGTRGARRMHQLANAVIVFDEIQSLPIPCVHLFNNAINFLTEKCLSTVVLCTATQPLLQEVNPEKGAIRLLDGHELMPNVRQLFHELRRVEIKDDRKPGGWTDDEVADLAVVALRDSGSCLAVVNTKRSAESIYRLCTDRTQARMVHLSTNMCAAHRKHILGHVKKFLEAKNPLLCISTQLIEAGVDVDFGCVIRFLAGFDSIAQAAGRCNRHGARPTGTVHVVNSRDEALDKLQDIRIGKEIAERMFDEFKHEPGRFANSLLGPEAMAAYYRYFFFARKSLMEYSVQASDVGRTDTLLNMLSLNAQAVEQYGRRFHSKPNTFLRQAFMSAAKAFKAIDAPTQGIIVPYGKAGSELVASLYASFDVTKDMRLLLSAQQYAVNVFPQVFEELQQAGALHQLRPDLRIFTLDSRFYSADFGLTTAPTEAMGGLHV